MALDKVSGAAASTPVIAAMVSVWRTFYNIVPFAGARAEASPAMWAGAGFLAGLMLRGAPSRSGTTAGAGAADPAPGRRLHGGFVAVRSPRSHAGPWIRFFFCLSGRNGPYETGLHSSSLTRRYLGAITGRSRPSQLIDFPGQTCLFAGASSTPR